MSTSPRCVWDLDWTMALSRKNLRRLDIDGATYVWALSPDSGYAVLVAQSSTGIGQKLEASLGDIYGRGLADHKAVTPGLVRQVLLDALDKGWAPNERGAPFHLPVTISQLKPK